MFRKSLLPDTDLDTAKLVTTVYTKNGEETRPIENLAHLVNFRGVPEYVRVPQLRPGEDMFHTHDGDCIIVEITEPVTRNFVVGLNYEWDVDRVKRTLTYSDGRTYVDHVASMPSKEEFQMEKEMFMRLAGVASYGKV